MIIHRKFMGDVPRCLLVACMVCLVAFAIAFLVLSLRWPIVHDLPILLYEGFLMNEFDYVPYRDFFDMNGPGTFFVYSALDALCHNSDLRCRLTDLLLLIGIAASTIVLLRPFGIMSGFAAFLFFTIGYLSGGPDRALQREYLCILPLSWSAVVAYRMSNSKMLTRSLLIGVLFGAIGSIRPHLLVAFPPVVVLMVILQSSENSSVGRLVRSSIKNLLVATSGITLVVAALICYLYLNGALSAFVEVARDYWPLYGQIDGRGHVADVTLVHLARRCFRSFAVLPTSPFLSLAALAMGGLLILPLNRVRRFEIGGFLIFALCGLLYILIGNKLWGYHRLPLNYWVAVLAGLGFMQLGTPPRNSQRMVFSVLVAALIVTSLPFERLASDLASWKRREGYSVKNGVVDEIDRYLREHGRPTDRVLPLDVADGVVHGMYRARARLAGTFIYDFHFYHHVENPLIKKLRRQLLDVLDEERPRFVIRSIHPWRPFGEQCDSEFVELNALLDERYVPVLAFEHIVIMERSKLR